MTHNNIDTKTQADIQIKGKIDDFFNNFSIAASLAHVVSENVMGIMLLS